MNPTKPCLHLDDTRMNASLRLKSAKGYLETVLRMLDQHDIYCIDFMKQIKAVQGALSKVNAMVFRAHVRGHVARASERGHCEHIVDELMHALKYQART